MSDVDARLRAALKTAMRARDAATLAPIRSALSALDNATAVPSEAKAGAIEAAAVGIGAAEVARRDLTEDEARAVVQGEIDERLAAASALPGDAGARVLAEAEVLAALLA